MKRLSPVLLALVVAACGQPATGTPDGAGSPMPGSPEAEPELFAEATVLDDGGGPELCVGPVQTSLPPQCGGPPIVGWSWSAVGGSATTVGGTTWGAYVVIGTYDGERFTLTRPPVPLEKYDGPRPQPPEQADLSTPCPEPPGGWHVVDPREATEAAFQRTAAAARRLDGFADLWIDQAVDPSVDGPAMNDPTKFIVNVRVASDPAEAEATLRRTWGGMLCVTRAEHTDAELRRIQDDLTDVPDMLSVSRGMGVVDVTVIHDDGTLQRRLDQRYGAGLVRVTSALQPYPGSATPSAPASG